MSCYSIPKLVYSAVSTESGAFLWSTMLVSWPIHNPMEQNEVFETLHFFSNFCAVHTRAQHLWHFIIPYNLWYLKLNIKYYIFINNINCYYKLFVVIRGRSSFRPTHCYSVVLTLSPALAPFLRSWVLTHSYLKWENRMFSMLYHSRVGNPTRISLCPSPPILDRNVTRPSLAIAKKTGLGARLVVVH